MNAPIPELRTRDSAVPENAFEVALTDGPLQTEGNGMPVLELLAALDRYQHLRDISHRERFGTPDPRCREALLELARLRQALRDIGAASAATGGELHIEASLNLRMLPRQA
ncbi:MAG: hypothetical protein R3228_16135 [Halioglobus sp.]|nr:hypothetical protein [Halioglobus sp.]